MKYAGLAHSDEGEEVTGCDVLLALFYSVCVEETLFDILLNKKVRKLW